MDKKIQESSSGLGKITGKKRWFARIIAAGHGSSAVHTEEALKNTGPTAWPIGTKIHADHQTWAEMMDRPENSIKTMAGVIASTPEFKYAGESEDIDETGLYAEVDFSETWAPFVEEFADFIGLSITSGYYGEEIDESTGLPVVEGYIPSKLNTVDLVTVEGAKGRLKKAIESYTEKHGIMDSDKNTSRKDGHTVTPEELQEAVKAAISDLIPAIKEALTPEVEETEDTPVETIAEAVATAALPEQARKRVYESIKAGVSVDQAVEAEKSYIKELTESFKEEQKGRLTEAGDKLDLSQGGWN